MHPARAPSLSQLPHQIDRRLTGDNDVPLGAVRGTVWRVRDSAEFQHPDTDPAAVFLAAVLDELGAVFVVWAVSICGFFLFSGEEWMGCGCGWCEIWWVF